MLKLNLRSHIKDNGIHTNLNSPNDLFLNCKFVNKKLIRRGYHLNYEVDMQCIIQFYSDTVAATMCIVQVSIKVDNVDDVCPFW